MKQRLLFDPIDLRRDNAVPDESEQLPPSIDSDSTGASMVRRNLAVKWAARASDKVIREAFIIQRGLEIAGHGKHGDGSRE
jgi:hypothetical protein